MSYRAHAHRATSEMSRISRVNLDTGLRRFARDSSSVAIAPMTDVAIRPEAFPLAKTRLVPSAH
jgi:hypothetical protein